MPKYPEETRNVSLPPPGRWVWSDEAQTVEFISSSSANEDVSRGNNKTDVDFKELQLRSEWLADFCTLNHRGRQSFKKMLSPAHLKAYRSSVMDRQGNHVTTDDVKQVAVSLLQENYLLPIPFCFLALLKRKELDEVLTTLLLYLTCFFENKSLQTKSTPLLADLITERKMMAKALAKKEIAQRQLAVCYFSLIMDLEIEKHQHTSYRKSRMSLNSTEWLLHACLYSFFCYAAWVTFSRKDLRDIQEEVGRLLYSDTFNAAVRNRGCESGMSSSNDDGSVKTGDGDPEETGQNYTFKRQNFNVRTSHRRPPLSTAVNQRSPLMVSLLPSPKELSPHLFAGRWARRQSSSPVGCSDTKALREELNQQLADVRFGILGKPLTQFNRSTLIPHGETKDSDKDKEEQPRRWIYNKDRPGFHVGSGSTSFTGPQSTGITRYDSKYMKPIKSAASSGTE